MRVKKPKKKRDLKYLAGCQWARPTYIFKLKHEIKNGLFTTASELGIRAYLCIQTIIKWNAILGLLQSLKVKYSETLVEGWVIWKPSLPLSAIPVAGAHFHWYNWETGRALSSEKWIIRLWCLFQLQECLQSLWHSSLQYRLLPMTWTIRWAELCVRLQSGD